TEGGHQAHLEHVIAQGAVAVVVLSVHVGGNGATDGHLAGTRRDGNEPTQWNRDGQKLINRHTGAHGDHSVGSDGADATQGAIVEHHTTAQLGRVTVTAAESARDGKSGLGQILGHDVL